MLASEISALHARLLLELSSLVNCRRLAAEGAGTVFVTDNALTTLMCAPRSVYSWDLVIVKADGKMWIDRRDQEGAKQATCRFQNRHSL